MSFSVGDRLAGRFEIRGVIGERPTGFLYHVFDEQIGVEVALRVISSELLADDTERRAFLPKATRVKALQHPNLLRLYDVLVGDSLVYLIMQWAPGERLSRRLGAADKGSVLSSFEVRGIVRAVAAGMAHAHQHGVVLGSVRPDTVILYPDGLKLTNIGLGPALPRDRFLSAMGKVDALQDLAPEVRAGKDPDQAADLYALGKLTQRLLERCESAALAGAKALLDRALSDDPTQRPRDAEGFARELEAGLRGPVAPQTASAVPTGSDTERVEKLALPLPHPVLEAPMPDLRSGELVLERHTTVADQVTNQLVKRGTAPMIDLELEELVEVVPTQDGAETRAIPRVDELGVTPEITDVGHRSPVRPELAVPEWSPPSDPLFHVPAPQAEPRLAPVAPVANPVAPAARSSVDIDALNPLEDDMATREIPRLEPGDPIVLARTVAEPILEVAATPTSRSPVLSLVVLLAAALSLGVLGMLVLRVMHPGERAPIIVVTTQAPAPTPSPVPTTSPIPAVTRTATPTVTPTPTPTPTPVTSPLPVASSPHGCGLGMAQLGGAHPYCIDLYEYPGGHTIPRTAVSFADARQICTSRGLRMCSDGEWEQACRGPGQSSYPYGSSFDPGRCNTGGKAGSAIKETGSMPRCRSAAGAYDMSGNVAEWSASGAQRGGSVRGGQAFGRCSHAVRGAPLSGADDVGFRCCGDVR